MLTLPDNELQLITEKTTIREIRELKDFNRQSPKAEEAGETEETESIEAAGSKAPSEWTPLEKCVIDFFKERKETLNGVMKHLKAEPTEYKEAAEMIAPSGQASHKKGIVFLFLYDWGIGVKYKLMTEPEPVSMTWIEFLKVIYQIYGEYGQRDAWSEFYKKQEKAQENAPIATSQQGKEGEENEGLEEELKGVDPVDQGLENHEEPGKEERHEAYPGVDEADGEEPHEPDREGQEGVGVVEGDREENRSSGEQEGKEEREPESTSGVVISSRKELREEARELSNEIHQMFQVWGDQDMPVEEMETAKASTERLLEICEQLILLAEGEWIKTD